MKPKPSGDGEGADLEYIKLKVVGQVIDLYIFVLEIDYFIY